MARPALAASRAVDVLNFLAAHPTEAFTLSDLSERVGINVASAHAVLAVLTDAGYLARHSRLRTYTLGPSVVALGTAALEHHTVIDYARDAARGLADELDVEVAVTASAGDEIVFLARAGEHRARGISVHVGQRVPLTPPLGSVFIAWEEEERVERWLARSTDRVAASAVLAAVRERGYSVGLEAEARLRMGEALDHLAAVPTDRVPVEDLLRELGQAEYQLLTIDRRRSYDVSLVAAPVFDTSGRVALALSLVGFERGLRGDELVAIGERARDVGLVLTKRTHGRLP